jgi:hypothetical protein
MYLGCRLLPGGYGWSRPLREVCRALVRAAHTGLSDDVPLDVAQTDFDALFLRHLDDIFKPLV